MDKHETEKAQDFLSAFDVPEEDLRSKPKPAEMPNTTYGTYVIPYDWGTTVNKTTANWRGWNDISSATTTAYTPNLTWRVDYGVHKGLADIYADWLRA